jgi:hypothetical protein
MSENSEKTAFPYIDRYGFPCVGLTKREYFAGLAMQGILAADTKEELKFSFEQIVPKIALMYADELLKQLETTK